MTDLEVNRGLAEFMGCTVEIEDDILYIEDEYTATNSLYTESLDALVPIWEKLKLYGYRVVLDMLYDDPTINVLAPTVEPVDAYRTQTIQQAASHATFKAVKELMK